MVFHFCFIIFVSNASLAQLVEQLIRNEQVAGSSPAKGSYLINEIPLKMNVSKGFFLFVQQDFRQFWRKKTAI